MRLPQRLYLWHLVSFVHRLSAEWRHRVGIHINQQAYWLTDHNIIPTIGQTQDDSQRTRTSWNVSSSRTFACVDQMKEFFGHESPSCSVVVVGGLFTDLIGRWISFLRILWSFHSEGYWWWPDGNRCRVRRQLPTDWQNTRRPTLISWHVSNAGRQTAVIIRDYICNISTWLNSEWPFSIQSCAKSAKNENSNWMAMASYTHPHGLARWKDRKSQFHHTTKLCAWWLA